MHSRIVDLTHCLGEGMGKYADTIEEVMKECYRCAAE